jgi:hypothetical protein
MKTQLRKTWENIPANSENLRKRRTYQRNEEVKVVLFDRFDLAWKDNSD